MPDASSARGGNFADDRSIAKEPSSEMAKVAPPAGISFMEDGLALQRAGRLAEAEACYRRVLAADANHAEAWHLLGVAALQQGHGQRAIEALEQAIRRDPENAAYLLSGGFALQNLQRYQEAITLYDRALALHPDDADILNNRGLALAQSGRVDDALASYNRALAVRPDYVEALNNRGNLLQALARFGEAIESYDRALALRPDLLAAHYNRGEALQSLGRFDDAIASFDRALALQPDLVEALINRANACQVLARFDQALQSYDRAQALRPDDAGILNNRALTLQRLKRFDEALESYGRALVLIPNDAEVLNNRGGLLLILGRFDEALASYEQVLVITPGFAAALSNRGNVLKRLGRFEEALESYDRALAAQPDSIEIIRNRCNTLEALGRFEEALESFDRLLALDPGSVETLHSRGNALQALGRFSEALDSYDRALMVMPGYVASLVNRGNTLRELGCFDAALESCERALAIEPDNAAALINRGITLRDLKRFDEALETCNRAVTIEPDNAAALINRGNTLRDLKRFDEAMENYDRAVALARDVRIEQAGQMNRAYLLLLLGRFAEGWRQYESRRRTKDLIGPTPPGREWSKGDRLAQRCLFYSEQGLGDTIQFCRFASTVAAIGRKVFLAVQPPLVQLLRGLEGVDVIAKGGELPDYDVHLPLMSLPNFLDIDPTTTPATVPYLFADPVRVAGWAKRLPADGFRIGIVWQGNPLLSGRGRAFPLAALSPLCRIPDVRLISLQKGDGTEQLSALPAGMAVQTLGADFDSGPAAFLDSAAVMMNLDLVICCDTASAHLAGALGRPVWIALRQVPDWRWMLDRDDTPWYPTARLFRQQTDGDWDEVFARIAAELAAMLARGRVTPLGLWDHGDYDPCAVAC